MAAAQLVEVTDITPPAMAVPVPAGAGPTVVFTGRCVYYGITLDGGAAASVVTVTDGQGAGGATIDLLNLTASTPATSTPPACGVWVRAGVAVTATTEAGAGVVWLLPIGD